MNKKKLKLRDKLALKAMAIIYSKTTKYNNFEMLAKEAYSMADWMLKIRDNK